MSVFKNFYFIVLSSAVVVFAFADLVNSVLQSNLSGGNYAKFSIYFRGLFELLILLWLGCYRKINSENLKLLLMCCFCFISSFFAYLVLLGNGFGNFSIYFNLINKYFFFFICFIFICKAFGTFSPVQKKYIYTIYELIIYTNSFCAILGLLFNIPLFKTYGGVRFGYIGFIPAVNEASLFWLIALFYSFVVYRKEHRKLPLIFSAAACCILGSKAALISVLAGVVWFFYKFYPKFARKMIVALLIAIFLLVYLYHEKVGEYLSGLEALEYFVWRMDKFDFLTIFMSGRNEYVYRFIDCLNIWLFPNYLFGGIMPVSNAVFLTTEMDVFDTIMIFGFVGGMVFISAYVKVFLEIQKSYRPMFLLLFFSMAAIGGHIFGSALNAVYLCLFICKAKQEWGVKNDFT